ncbi:MULTISPECIES: lysophospholipid acyltransferase family protein [unclassified Exiguobacterium]|uniref:lysophospholipid acyltransferase family protein n=1 Tax=unclassified Exiguobacterium TaxID=2644629 RepID=UPI0025BEDDF3|nr:MULTISPECIES: lysophospholipid acyltransferase family protein [unclassified Exiguobacterium]
MKEANKSKLAESVFHTYVDHALIQRHFHRVLYRADDLPVPGLMLATHSSWWDGMILFHLDQTCFRHDPYVMIDQAGLARFPFFSRLGAFSVDRTSFSDIKTSLQYAKARLQNGSSVWMFPQGEERHQEERPMHLASGATQLMRHANTVSLVAFYYSYGHEQQPDVYVRTRRFYPLSDERSSFQVKRLTVELTALYDDIRADAMAERVDLYRCISKRREPLPARTERWLRALRS